MALANGVLVHGPTSWACAVRTPTGELKVAAERKRLLASGVESPLLRGPAKLLESVVFLPRLKRLLPEATLPFVRPGVVAAMAGTAVIMPGVRRSRLGNVTKELVGGVISPRPVRAGTAGEASLPPTTAPSTSRSEATSTASRARVSTSAAARTSSARCLSRARSGTCLPLRHRPGFGPPPVWQPLSARWQLQPSSSDGCSATPTVRRPRACLAGPRVPAPTGDCGAVPGAARGCRGGARRLSRARARAALVSGISCR